MSGEEKTAIIVVDMLRGFCEEGNTLYCGDDCRKIIPNIRKLLDVKTAQGAKVIFLIDTHQPDDKEFQMFPPHCVVGSPEREIISELAGYKGERISKNRYSGFYNTELDEKLRELGIERLVVVGVCTDICVMHTVADARNRDYPVEVYTDCVASFDPEAHEWALKHMEKILGAKLKSTSEL